MTKDMEILCAGEEVLMRVRYVSPPGGLTLQMDGLPCRCCVFGLLWFVWLVVVVVLVCLFCFAVVCLVCWLLLSVFLRLVPTHLDFHTPKDRFHTEKMCEI